MNNIDEHEEELKKYETILNHCEEICKNQDKRKNDVDTKTSYMLVVAVFLMGILLENSVHIDLIFSNDINSLSVMEIIVRFHISLCYIASLILCLIGIFNFILVLINKKYEKLKVEIMRPNEINKEKYIKILKGLINNYIDITLINSKVNDKTLKQYKRGVILILITMFFTVGIFLIAPIFKGGI